MAENDKTDADDAPKSSKDQKGSQQGLWWIIAAGFIAVIAVIFVGSFWISAVDRTRFITEFILTVALADLVAVQAYIYKKQWTVMDRQLTAFEHPTAQNEWEFRQAQRNASAVQSQMQEQSKAMKGQLEAMKTQAAASEIQAKAAERSVEVMRESYIATTRAYIGVRRIVMGALVIGQMPTVTVVWHNGGNTPASRFRAVVYLVFGEKPERRGYFLDDDWSDSTASFVPPGVSNPVDYPQVEIGFKPVTKEMLDALNGSKRLYAMVEAVYLDFTEQRRSFDSSYIFKPETGTFTELYEYTTQ